MFLNIHTHHSDNRPEVLSIQNVFSDFLQLNPVQFYSVGLHPWYLQCDASDEDFNDLNLVSRQNNVLAIGECGLDKLCGIDFSLQEIIFKKQIVLANQIGKPLIIHCVKAYDEVFSLLRQCPNNMPVLFHGFIKNKELADAIIRQGYFISFGKSILANERVRSVFKLMDVSAIFLETDHDDADIIELYREAAIIKNISLPELQRAINDNALRFFNKNKHFQNE